MYRAFFSFLSRRPTSKELVGECWLQSARVARKAGHLQTAFNALLNAENTHLAELVSEKAKWLWSKVTPAPVQPSVTATWPQRR